MGFLTNDKLVIVGAAGMIGSNMAQTAMMLKLTPNICLYDVYEPGLKGVVAEMRRQRRRPDERQADERQHAHDDMRTAQQSKRSDVFATPDGHA